MVEVTWVPRVLRALVAGLSVVLLGSLGPAWGADPTPADPVTVTDTVTPAPATETVTPAPATETTTATATATETATATVTASPTATATVTAGGSGPYVGTGFVIDPSNGRVGVSKGAYVVFGSVLWIVSLVLGLVTAVKVLP